MKPFTRREFIRNSIGVTAGVASITKAEDTLSFFGSATGNSGRKPNIILILADDMGFSDVGCFGSKVNTPNIDSLAADGLKFTEFYNCGRCCPTRASLMTGLYSHQSGFGLMTGDLHRPAYTGDLSDRCVTIAEAMRTGGYHTLMCGKWHLTPAELPSKHNWPLQRGFERFVGTIEGAGSYFDPVTLTRNNTPIRADKNFYYTDSIAENASSLIEEYGRKQDPFFLYAAFTAPHWPLQAHPDDIAKYEKHFADGWDAHREGRYDRMIELGIIDPKWKLSPRDPRVPPWPETLHREWEARRMAVYAAQIEALDRGIGQIRAKVKEAGIEDNTLILFLSDNGGNLEELTPSWRGYLFVPHETLDGKIVRLGNDPSVMPGAADTYQSYGRPWANVSNTPFRLYKHFANEGGISTPLIACWPGVTQKDTMTNQTGHVMDIMATCLDIAGLPYPKTYGGQEIIPLEGKSLLPIFQGKQREPHEAIFWEHEGNRAVRHGKWKLVSSFPNYWELHDMEADRTELNNLVAQYPEKVQEMDSMYRAWASRVGVARWPISGKKQDEDYLRHDRA